jgi:hypothetical protein
MNIVSFFAGAGGRQASIHNLAIKFNNMNNIEA